MPICIICRKLIPGFKGGGDQNFGFCAGHHEVQAAVRRVYDNNPEYGEFVKKIKSSNHEIQ